MDIHERRTSIAEACPECGRIQTLIADDREQLKKAVTCLDNIKKDATKMKTIYVQRGTMRTLAVIVFALITCFVGVGASLLIAQESRSISRDNAINENLSRTNKNHKDNIKELSAAITELKESNQEILGEMRVIQALFKTMNRGFVFFKDGMRSDQANYKRETTNRLNGLDIRLRDIERKVPK